MNNIYNAIQNLYNMDKTTWQEVLTELYNLCANVENKFDLFELKFGSLLGEQVTRELKKMYDNGSLASLINDKLLKDINTKVTEVSGQLGNKANDLDLEVERKRIDLLTKIENGQTEGNTELLDIRIGADGFEYRSAGDGTREQFRKLNDTLNLKIIKKSSNFINSLSVKGKSFESVFPNSNKVYFDLGVGMSIPNNVKLMGRIIFTDGTYPVGDGTWYADNKDGTNILTGGNNIAKEITSNAETITKVGFYFGSSSRPNYEGKIIDKIIFTTYYEGQANLTEDYYIKYGSGKLEDIEKNLENVNTRIDEISKKENNLICEWYNENEYIIASGLELNIYYDTICNTNVNAYYKVTTDASSSFCNTLDRCLRFKTNSVIGNYNIEISCIEKGSNKVLGTTNFTVRVVANTPLTVPKKCMFIGDSLTDSGIITKTIKELGGNNLILYGVRGNDNNLHEGRAGWKCSTYLYTQNYENKSNAFFNPSKEGSVKFDFNYYMTNNPNFSDVEFVNIFLGRNDTYNGLNLVGNLQKMISDIHSYNSNIIITIVLPYFTPRQSDEWGSIRKTNAEELYQASFIGYKNFKDGLNNLNNVYLVPLGVNLDIVNDFPYTQKAISNRNTKTYGVYTDIIHPLECGYQKFADVWYSWFINYINN